MKELNKIKLVKIKAIDHEAAYINPQHIKFIEKEDVNSYWKIGIHGQTNEYYEITDKCAQRLLKKYGVGLTDET